MSLMSPATRPRTRLVSPLDRAVPPRLVVISPTGADVVRWAGGWLFDRVLAGWKATVLTAEPDRSRSLRILGVRPVPMEPGVVSGTSPFVSVVAVQAALAADDAVARRLVQQVLNTGTADLWLWESACLDKVKDGKGAVEHQLSAAARAFKGQALAAAALPDRDPGAVETFRLIRLGDR
jgi:hypothetical protein